MSLTINYSSGQGLHGVDPLSTSRELIEWINAYNDITVTGKTNFNNDIRVSYDSINFLNVSIDSEANITLDITNSYNNKNLSEFIFNNKIKANNGLTVQGDSIIGEDNNDLLIINSNIKANNGIILGNSTSITNGSLRFNGSNLQLYLNNFWFNILIDDLYVFSTHTFTNCGKTGRFGPVLNECTNSYGGSGSNWWNNTGYFNVNTPGFQEWTVPSTGFYIIEAGGAKGGSGSGGDGGNGAKVTTSFYLTSTNVIKIIVGQQGTNQSSGSLTISGGGGGGGTYVLKSPYNTTNSVIVAAGGGGGGSEISGGNGGITQSTTTSGGSIISSLDGGGGAGFNNDGNSHSDYLDDRGYNINNTSNPGYGGEGYNNIYGGFGGGGGAGGALTAQSGSVLDTPLAGANGIKSHNAYGLYGNDATDIIPETNFNHPGHYLNSSSRINKVNNNVIGPWTQVGQETAVGIRNNNNWPIGIAYEFDTAQVCNKYIIWGALASYNIKTWELRAAADKATYDSQDEDTYDTLDTQENYTITGITGTQRPASTNTSDGYTFTFTNTTAYKYYILHITANQGNQFAVFIGELALYNSSSSIFGASGGGGGYSGGNTGHRGLTSQGGGSRIHLDGSSNSFTTHTGNHGYVIITKQ